ncbi:MAG TPA: chromophore lyase, partial [Actinomycetota bacterium]|nr:chromophore lyase [Actinomycetota bacterium]
LRLEAFQITVKDKGALYGTVSVEYRAHVQGIGWQPWRRDGQTAGTTGKALRIEAVQIRIVQGPEPEPTPTPTPTSTATPSPSTR